MTIELDWDDIQGNILRGYGFDYAHHLVLTVTDTAAAQRWLADLVPAVTPATPWVSRPAHTLNVAFSFRGLAALGLDDAALASFPPDFREGMRARAHDVGDVDEDDPENWEPSGVQHPEAHVLLMAHATSAEAADVACDRMVRTATARGLGLIGREDLGNLLSDQGVMSWRRQEHFGFADGVSQPAVEGALAPTTIRGNGTPLGDGTWRPLRPGEFVLGYPDEEEDEPPIPSPPALARNGSFLVYRKLAQDVAVYRQLLAEVGHRHDVPADRLGAKLVGRHADGSPLAPLADDATGLNDVRYEDDLAGYSCPVGSHVRRANPRDGLRMEPELVSRHRLLRRGMPYGTPLPASRLDDDGVPRGLMFLAYCASIARQFEFLQREWMNDGNVFGVGHAADPIAGHGSAPRRFAFELPGRCPVVLDGLPRLVQTCGGEYLFQPGLTGLRYLARLGGG